jgi:3-oxoacyl-[acyl-carrier protein] reductase
MDLKLKGRKAIITGSSKGIGRAIADALADEAATLRSARATRAR